MHFEKHNGFRINYFNRNNRITEAFTFIIIFIIIKTRI